MGELSPEVLRKCKEAWTQTLRRFGIERNLIASEEVEIARAVQKHGADTVELALYGAGFEPRTERFDPKNFVRISRVLRPDPRGEERIDRFVNLGSQQRAKDLQARDTRRAIEAVRTRENADEWAEQDPAKVREILNNVMKGMS